MPYRYNNEQKKMIIGSLFFASIFIGIITSEISMGLGKSIKSSVIWGAGTGSTTFCVALFMAYFDLFQDDNLPVNNARQPRPPRNLLFPNAGERAPLLQVLADNGQIRPGQF